MFDLPLLSQLPEVALRLTLAALFGAVFGWNRESREKPAGLRTHMMVALGAASAAVAALQLAADVTYEQSRLDPTRVIEGVLGGIGFLGAGSIIQSRGSVRGMTTAATIWVVGAVGIGCGLGYYSLAFVTVTLGIIILSGVGRLEHWFWKSDSK